MNVTLAQRYAVKGRFYGPGEVEVSEAVAATLRRRGAFDNPLTQFPQLIAAGYTSIEEARAMDDSVLLRIEGVGPATIKKIRGLAEAEAEAEPAKPAKPRFIGETADAAEAE